MIGVNRTGVDGKGLEYELSSSVIDPMGKDVESTQLSEIIDVYDIDKEAVVSYRDSFPVKKDRRIELYKEIL